MQAIILAGGKGTRLKPYTTVFPKPLMPIGDVPILHIIVKQLKYYGFKEITMAVGRLGELIMAYFNDGAKFGVNIRYSKEETPLGTVGPLAFIHGLDTTFLLMNGDILTTLDYSKLIGYHRENKAIATIAMHKRNVNIDFGVIETNLENEIINYIEKPSYNYLVSMGIYVFEPGVLQYIEPGKKLDFPELIQILLKDKKRVVGYPYEGYWLDIGRHDDYQKAIEDFDKRKDKFYLSME